MTRSPRLVLMLAVLGAPLAGCYENVPVSGPLAPGLPVAFEVSDESRLALRDRIGRDADRVEGIVVAATEQALTLRMEKVVDLRGEDTKWNGEEVAFARRDATRTYHRRLDKVRTYVTVGLVAGLTLAFAASAGALTGLGGGTLDPPAPPPAPDK